ncbi:hypothetical protein ACP4OV_018113 [Aristida adscensionis]
MERPRRRRRPPPPPPPKVEPPRRRRRKPPTSLDDLPPEVLEKIVSYLPVRDAVRTSALSRAWRRRWESAPGLRMAWFGGEPAAAVDDVLARYAARPVSDFCYWDVPEAAFPHADGWVAALADKGVQSLSLRFGFPVQVPHFCTLHPAIFLCRDLNQLSLDHCYLPAAPSIFGFPKLTTLSLTVVGLLEHRERDLEALISSAPLLKSLELDRVWIDAEDIEDWVIRAPNLERLIIESVDDYEWQIGELPSLQSVTIRVDGYSIGRDFVKLFTCFAQVRDLEFSMPFTEVNALEGLSCSFQKLKCLTLHTDFCNVPMILSTFSLLRSAPNLEELKIKILDNQTQNNEVNLDFFTSLWTNNTCTNLKLVTMTNTRFWSNEMHFIEFILSKARRLCGLFVYRDDRSDYSKLSKAAGIQIAKFKRVSPKAEVFLKSMKDFWAHGFIVSDLAVV